MATAPKKRHSSMDKGVSFRLDHFAERAARALCCLSPDDAKGYIRDLFVVAVPRQVVRARPSPSSLPPLPPLCACYYSWTRRAPSATILADAARAQAIVANAARASAATQQPPALADAARPAPHLTTRARRSRFSTTSGGGCS